MLDASLNHASIMAWVWFNEGPSQHEEACPAYAACAAYVRARDPTRFAPNPNPSPNPNPNPSPNPNPNP